MKPKRDIGGKNYTVVTGEIVTQNKLGGTVSFQNCLSLENSSKNINFLNIFFQDFFAKIVNYGYILCMLFNRKS